MNGREVPTPVLMHWYQCGRKRRYDSETAAAAAASELMKTGMHDTESAPHGLSGYQCPYADDQHWHIGRPMRDVTRRTKWRPRDERRQKERNARKTWDRIAYKHMEEV